MSSIIDQIKQLESIENDAKLIEKAQFIVKEIIASVKSKKHLFVEFLEFAVFFGLIDLVTKLLEAGCPTNEKLLEIAYEHRKLVIYRILLYYRCAVSAQLEDQIHDDNEPQYMTTLMRVAH